MKTVADIMMFTKLTKEEINELTASLEQNPDRLLYRPKKFTVSDLWYIHRNRKSFERRRHIFSK